MFQYPKYDIKPHQVSVICLAPHIERLSLIYMKLTIRKKLILILVSMSLLPFIIFYSFNVISYRVVSGRIKSSIRTSLQKNAKNSLILLIEDFEVKQELLKEQSDVSQDILIQTRIINTFRIPKQWANDSEILLVELVHSDSSSPELKIITHKHATRDTFSSPNNLTKNEIPELEAIIHNARKEVNVRKTMYNGDEVLLGHGTIKESSSFPLIIVPYETILGRSNEVEQILFTDHISRGRLLMVSVAFILIFAISLAIYRARNITVPITQLTEASKKLANGDFDVKVEIKTGDEIQQLAEVFNSTGPKLKEREKIKASLELARSIQSNLLPKTNPQISNFDIAGSCKYCDETGGDYYDFITYNPDHKKMGIVLGDVSGHGIGAALLMATARSILRSTSYYHQEDLNKILFELNNQLKNDTGEDKFMTLFYGILDNNNKTLKWTSGGHDPAIMYHKKINVFEELPNTGMAIGLLDNVTFETLGPVNLEQNDIIVIGTDGIWESQNSSGEFFGKKRLREIIENNSDRTALEICNLVIQKTIEFCDKQTDDITLIVVKTL